MHGATTEQSMHYIIVRTHWQRSAMERVRSNEILSNCDFFVYAIYCSVTVISCWFVHANGRASCMANGMIWLSAAPQSRPPQSPNRATSYEWTTIWIILLFSWMKYAVVVYSLELWLIIWPLCVWVCELLVLLLLSSNGTLSVCVRLGDLCAAADSSRNENQDFRNISEHNV